MARFKRFLFSAVCLTVTGEGESEKQNQKSSVSPCDFRRHIITGVLSPTQNRKNRDVCVSYTTNYVKIKSLRWLTRVGARITDVPSV